MREFILHEAKEKADEIGSKAEQDYTVEKQRLVEEEKLRLKKEYERKENNVEHKSKIANATEMNRNKLQVLAAASSEIEATFVEALEQLKKVASDAGKYQAMLAALITEGAAKLNVSDIKVRCRPEDKSVVQKAISDVKLGCNISIADEPLTVDESCTTIDKKCIGGVIVTSADGKVQVSQTFNARLQVAYETAFPVVKPLLFNQLGSKHTDGGEK